MQSNFNYPRIAAIILELLSNNKTHTGIKKEIFALITNQLPEIDDGVVNAAGLYDVIKTVSGMESFLFVNKPGCESLHD